MTGIGCIALQVDDVEASAAFLSTHMGWTRADGPPGPNLLTVHDR